MSQVSYGTITITDTTDIERIYVEYCRSTSNQLSGSTVPGITVAWSENTPSWVNGQYIWQRSVVKKSGSTDLIYGTPVCLTGAAGATGASGQSLTATKTEYTIAASNVTINLSNHTSYTWTTNTPDYDASKPAYWGRVTNTYANPAKTEYLFYKDEALTKAVSDAAIANSVAQHANEDAQGALSQAAAAQQLATQVDTLLGGHFLWHGTALSTLTKAGARVVEQVKNGTTDVSSTPSQWLHNVNIGANGIQLRYNEAVMAQLAATNSDSSNDIALKFYQPPTISGNTTTQGNLTMALRGNALTFYDPTVANGQSVQAILDANGLVLKKGGIESGTLTSGNGYVYLSTEDKAGITINGYTPGNSDPKWRQIIGTKFGVDSEGNLYANGAHVVNINASNINTGYLNAERIKAESLTLGQVNGLKKIMSDLEDSVYGVTTYVYEHQDTSTSETISEVVYLDNSGTEPRYYYISNGVEYEVSESQLKTEVVEGQTQLVTVTTNITTDISTQMADFNDSINSELATLNRTVNNYLGADGYINLVTDGSEPCIIIGQGEFFVKITNTEMGFYQRPENTTSIEENVDGVTKVAWISSNELVISQSQIRDRQQIGDFIWEVRETTNGYKISLKHNKRTGENNE